MPIVRNTVNLPGQNPAAQITVTIELTTRPAFEADTDIEILGLQSVPVDRDTGDWEADLVAQADIDPPDTVYRVVERAGAKQAVHYIIVPDGGGPYELVDVRRDALTPPATAAPSNESDSYSPGANSGNIAVTGFTLQPVPDAAVEIADVARPTIVLGMVNVRHASTANAILYAGLAPEGVTSLVGAVGLGTARAGSAGVAVTVPFLARVPAHSPGVYTLGVNGDSGNLVVVGGPNNITIIEALEV